jgi:hypothetical protein
MILYWLLLITVGTNTEQIHKVFPPARRLLVALSVCCKVEIVKISTIMTFVPPTYLSQPRSTVDYYQSHMALDSLLRSSHCQPFDSRQRRIYLPKLTAGE